MNARVTPGEVRRQSLPPGFRVIWITVAIDLIGFGIVIPLLPQYAASFGAGGATIGLLVASFSLAQLVMAPMMGRLSDRFGRRPVLLISLFGSGLGSLITGLAGSVPLLFLGRIIDGASGASVSVAQASAADLAGPRDRARLMGLLGAAFGIGFVAGPSIGALGALGGVHIPFFVAAAISFTNFAVAVFRLPETHPERAADAASVDGELLAAATSPDGPGLADPAHLALPSSGHVPEASDTANEPAPSPAKPSPAEPSPASTEHVAPAHAVPGTTAVLRVITVSFAAMVAFSAFEATFALLGEERLDFSLSTTGIVFAAVGALLVLVQVRLVAPVNDALGEARTLRLALGLNIGGLCLLSIDLGWAGLAPALVLLVAGQGLLAPTLASGVAARAGSARGRWLGWQQSASGLARVVGPAAGGWMFEHVAQGAPYLAGAAVLVLGLVLVPDGSPDVGESSSGALPSP